MMRKLQCRLSLDSPTLRHSSSIPYLHATPLSGRVPAAARDGLSQTPLHLASLNHSPAGIVPLVEAGADVNARSNIGISPLDLALSSNSSSNTKTAEYLICRGANPNDLASTGTTVLNNYISQGKPECVSILLRNSADLSTADFYRGKAGALPRTQL